jgi:deoxyribose-phosphate aldolase
MDRGELAAVIDQTLLRPTVGFREAGEWMDAQVGLGFATLCVSPFLVPLASQKLAGSGTAVCSVVGFPFGYCNTETKAEEARLLVGLGCAEVDMVMNVAAFLEGDDEFVADDVGAVAASARDASGGEALLKVIIETGHLGPEEVSRAAALVAESGADFVKTSTGFGPRGASVEDVELIREAVGMDVGVKAAGGIRDGAAVLAMLEAGATRIGSSSGVEILEAWDAGRVQ